jgi:acyl-CoA dehydrogenase
LALPAAHWTRLKRVRERELFGAPLAELQMVQGHIADMALDVDASALLIYRAAWTKDTGARTRHPRGGDGEALQLPRRRRPSSTRQSSCMAAMACAHGHVVERLYREIRALRIYEGASDVQKRGDRPSHAVRRLSR